MFIIKLKYTYWPHLFIKNKLASFNCDFKTDFIRMLLLNQINFTEPRLIKAKSGVLGLYILYILSSFHWLHLFICCSYKNVSPRIHSIVIQQILLHIH